MDQMWRDFFNNESRRSLFTLKEDGTVQEGQDFKRIYCPPECSASRFARSQLAVSSISTTVTLRLSLEEVIGVEFRARNGTWSPPTPTKMAPKKPAKISRRMT